MKTIHYFLILLSLLFSLSLKSQAADQFSQQVAKADSIVQGRIIKQNSEWRNGKVVTLNHILVRDDLTNTGTEEIVIMQQGGTAIHPVLNVEVTQTVSHQVKLKQGDEALYFTNKISDQQWQLVNGVKSVMPLVGIGTNKVLLAGYKQLKVNNKPEEKRVMAKMQGQNQSQKIAVLTSEALTLGRAKDRLRNLLQAKALAEIAK